ncbi:diacylglycerol/lipid kinase family protein [Sinomonas halotolerans]|uniref:YegS/Rv2252/BmrU family lipid kinase n=1 Tax=Sinomonas halotolerans TaxID=1644133 RepID=A0ABU9X053_9MICC
MTDEPVIPDTREAGAPVPGRRTPPRIVVAVNPSAHGGRGAPGAQRAVALLRERGADVLELRREGARELAEAVAGSLDGADAVVAVGGDGVVNLVANVLAGTDTPLGVIPTGTGNDAARLLGIPLQDVGAAVDAVFEGLGGPVRRIDLGRVEWDGGHQDFVNVASAGFDARVAERANRWRWPRGQAKYTAAMVRELASFRPLPMTLTVDGARREIRAMLVSVANGPAFGGGMLVAPEASAEDGRLDLVVLSPLSRPAFVRVFPKVFRGEHVGHPAVGIEPCTSVRIEAEGVVVYADGERIAPAPVRISIVPRALAVLAPS